MLGVRYLLEAKLSEGPLFREIPCVCSLVGMALVSSVVFLEAL